jgi:predicted protein tyrosine phosphatase
VRDDESVHTYERALSGAGRERADHADGISVQYKVAEHHKVKSFLIGPAHSTEKRFVAAGGTHAVSYRDYSFPHPQLELADDDWLRFEMFDRYFPWGSPESDAIGAQVEQLIAWAQNLPDDAVVSFNCMMGISRSTAAALIVCVVRYGVEEGTNRFFNEYGYRGCAPNEVMLEHADQQLVLGNQLAQFGEAVYTYYIAMNPRALVPHRKHTPAPAFDPWDEIDEDSGI